MNSVHSSIAASHAHRNCKATLSCYIVYCVPRVASRLYTLYSPALADLGNLNQVYVLTLRKVRIHKISVKSNSYVVKNELSTLDLEEFIQLVQES